MTNARTTKTTVLVTDQTDANARTTKTSVLVPSQTDANARTTKMVLMVLFALGGRRPQFFVST